ncbi:MAG TPA: alpha/beta hydrolase [Candidatus Dormibacteraeota bacterium]|nr:alpha/beta hydrolase [Candidatus Dormibacteraeota bacterium]
MDFDSDGVRLHYEVNGPANGTALIAVHGFASDYRLNWVGTRWQETLSGAGFRVIGLDCRGHGHSDKPHDPSAYSLSTMAGDVARLLDHLDIGSAAYLGYSMGARIGLQVVLDHPRRVSRAVLGGIGSAGAMDHANEIAHALEIGEPTEDPIAQTFFRFATSRPINDLMALAACMRGMRPHADPSSLAGVKVPILVVVGDQDDVVRGAPELIELLPSARLVTIAGRDHLSAVPAGEFKRAALEFLAAE